MSVANERASSMPSRSPRCSSASLMVRPARISRLVMCRLAVSEGYESLNSRPTRSSDASMLRPAFGAHHQQVHEIRKPGLMLGLPRLDALVDIKAGPEVTGDAAQSDQQPEYRSAGLHRGEQEQRHRKPDGQRGAAEEEIANRIRVVEA